MSSDELYELLGVRRTGEIRWGLRRTRELLRDLGSPHMAFASAHIGGTNGKGSAAAVLAAVLGAAGHRVGLYTSPHLVDFRERVQVDGAMIDAELVSAAARRIGPRAHEIGATFFEATTALAFLCFAEAMVDIVVAEVGLGGRLDATNVLLPEITAITQVAWDHSDFLGDSLAAIAHEKAGICKPGVPLVLGRLEPEAARIVRGAAERAGAPVLQVGRDAAVRRIRAEPDHTEFEYAGPGSPSTLRLQTALLGAHQAWNAGLAVLAAASLPDRWRPAPDAIERGVSEVRWPGRLQVERRDDRTWVLDVAHNTMAVEALAQALAVLRLPEPVAAVIAILGDKPWPEMLPPLLAMADLSVFTVAPSSPPERRWDPRAAAATVPGYPVEVIDSLERAIDRAAAAAQTVVITGSHHTVGDAMSYLNVPVGLPAPSGGR